MTTAGPTTDPAVEDDGIDASEFRRGGAQAEETNEQERAARKAAMAKTEWLSSFMKEGGDSVIIRFITDEPYWPEFAQHTYVPTKGAPDGKPADAKWPSVTGAICRRSKKKNGEPFFEDCYICDHMKKSDGKSFSRGTRLWALACIRKEVIGTEEMVAAGRIQANQVGRRVGFIDDIVEYDEMKDGQPTGTKLKKKRVVIVNYAMDNFFSQFITFANAKLYGTAMDRDYLITRKGNKDDPGSVKYVATPMDVIMKPIVNEAGETVGTEPFDLRNPKYLAQYEGHGIDLIKIIKRLMSKEHYERYFDKRVTVKWSSKDEDAVVEDGGVSSGTSSGAAASATAEPAAGSVTNERLQAMRDRVMANNQGAAATSEGTPGDGGASPQAAAPAAPVSDPAPSTGSLIDFSPAP